MFWKMVLAMALLYGAALYFGYTMGGAIHLLPIAAGVFWIVRRMAREPDSEFGRWRAPPAGRNRSH